MLVTKCTPKANSLKGELEKVRNIFGSVALKSLIILFIIIAKKEFSDQDILNELLHMESILDILEHWHLIT